MTGSSKNSTENYPRKCFWTQEKETRVKFNPGLGANRPSNNWALFTSLLCDNSNSLTYEPRKGAKSNTCQLCDVTSHADWLFTIINRNLDVWRPVSFCNQCPKKGSCLAIAFKTWRNKLSELKSRIARENLVNYDATIYHNDKNPGIS